VAVTDRLSYGLLVVIGGLLAVALIRDPVGLVVLGLMVAALLFWRREAS
jgi:hypothetical protein